MPIFEYSCQDCGSRFEKLVRNASESAAMACPSCGARHVRQELSVFAAHANNAPKPSAAPSGGPCPGCRHPEACGF
jgi:putative FmdB family regulatory protein